MNFSLLTLHTAQAGIVCVEGGIVPFQGRSQRRRASDDGVFPVPLVDSDME